MPQLVEIGAAIGTDPKVHIDAVQELFDNGIKLVNIHVGQMDQRRAIEFYGKEMLPVLRRSEGS